MRKVKFEVGDLLPLGLTLVVAGIGIAYGLNVIGDLKTDFGTDSCEAVTLPAGTTWGFNSTSGLCYNATSGANLATSSTIHPPEAYYNATRDSVLGISKLPERLPLIVTVIVAAVIIGILIRYIMVRFG